MQAKAWTKAIAMAAAMPAPSPSQTEPVTAATAADMNADISIFPSRLISMMPERSENSPAMAQRIKGVETRNMASRVSTASRKDSSISGRLGFARGGPEP